MCCCQLWYAMGDSAVTCSGDKCRATNHCSGQANWVGLCYRKPSSVRMDQFLSVPPLPSYSASNFAILGNANHPSHSLSRGSSWGVHYQVGQLLQLSFATFNMHLAGIVTVGLFNYPSVLHCQRWGFQPMSIAYVAWQTVQDCQERITEEAQCFLPSLH